MKKRRGILSRKALSKIWQKIETFNISMKFSTWLCKIVANSAIDRMRQIRRNNYVNLDNVIGKIDHLNLETHNQMLIIRKLQALSGGWQKGCLKNNRSFLS
jgi:DNA-directed RNA polymerase specialized sigma24 family protein